MTAPRQILRGTTWLVSRRCSERRFFLRPSKATNAIFLHVLAVAATRHRVQVHVVCVLSNHYHLLVTDPDARLPDFMRDLGSLVARAANASIGHWENFWSSEGSYSAVALETRSDIVRKAAYVLANPTAAGLVLTGSEWPGLWSAPDALGTATLAAPRPRAFFRHAGDMPELAELALTLPPGFTSPGEFQALVKAELHRLEEEARRKVHAKGRRFLGRARVLAQDPLARPPSVEPRRKLRPRVAARDTSKRIEALSRLVAFLGAYREAWTAFAAGAREVLFPAGTYRLRVEFGVRCAGAG